MSNFAFHIGISLLAGMVGGCIFFIIIILCLSRIEPKLIISKYIAKSVHQGVTRYDFKIINCSSLRAAINMRAELVLIENNESKNGKYSIPLNGIDIHNGDNLSLNRYNKHDKKSGYTEIVSTHLNLDELLATGKQNLRLKIIATDAFSGVTKVFEQSFPDKSLIKLGLHGVGESVNVSPQPDSSIKSVT
ncbi:hypothetical protein AB7M22_001074 [Pseudomonas sp. ADAK2 TE3594]